MADDIITKPFRVTLKDQFTFGVVSYFRNMFLTPRALLFVILIFALPVANYLTERDVAAAARSLALMLCFWLVIIPALSLLSIWRTYRSSRLINSLHTGRLSDSGFEVEGEAFKSMLLWSNFRRVRDGRSKIFLYLTNTAAHIVPKSAFKSSEDAEAFVKRANESIAAARNSVVSVFDAPSAPLPSTGWQSLPFRHTFSMHAVSYAQLFYAAILKPFTLLLAPVIICGFTLWQNRYDVMDGYWDEIMSQLIGFAIGYPIILVLLPWITLPLSWLNIRKTAAIRGTRTVSLTPDRMISHGETYHSELNWADLKGVRKGFGQILVYTRPNCAIITPMSAFPDKAAANAFYRQALTYYKAATAAAKSTAAAKTLDGQA